MRWRHAHHHQTLFKRRFAFFTIFVPLDCFQWLNCSKRMSVFVCASFDFNRKRQFFWNSSVCVCAVAQTAGVSMSAAPNDNRDASVCYCHCIASVCVAVESHTHGTVRWRRKRIKQCMLDLLKWLMRESPFLVAKRCKCISVCFGAWSKNFILFIHAIYVAQGRCAFHIRCLRFARTVCDFIRKVPVSQCMSHTIRMHGVSRWRILLK